MIFVLFIEGLQKSKVKLDEGYSGPVDRNRQVSIGVLVLSRFSGMSPSSRP